jgi:cytochrome c oxidase assembly protein subunit 15
VIVTAAQGLIGLVQYFTGVPEALVVAHVLGAVLLTATAAAVAMGTRRRPELGAEPVSGTVGS